MKLSAHQPQYMPGLRFFSKMKNSDLFAYLDDVQYEKREFQNRNKVRTGKGWQYLTVPVMVKGKFSQKINEVRLNPTYAWQTEHWRAIQLNYSKARYFRDYAAELAALYSGKYARLMEIACASVDFLRNAFGIATSIVFSSSFKLSSVSTSRLVELCAVAGVDEYYSGAGAREYLDEKLFAGNHIKLTWQNFKVLPYPQVFAGFEPDMSALDLLLNCGPESLKYL